MKKLIEYDPLTKTSTWFESNGNGFNICQTQDVEAILKRNKNLRNDTQYKRNGIKNDMYHYFTVPNTVLHELLIKYRLDWTNEDDLYKIEKVIQRDYPYLMTVDKI